MKKRKVVILSLVSVVLILALGAGGAYLYYSLWSASPRSLVGTYAPEDGGPVRVTVEAVGGGYFLDFEQSGAPGTSTRVPAIPMTADDQRNFHDGTTDAGLVGLNAIGTPFMIFRMHPGEIRGGQEFGTGYGCYGGPFPKNLTVLQRL